MNVTREEIRQDLESEDLRQDLSVVLDKLSFMLRKELSLALREEFHEKLNIEIKIQSRIVIKKIENLSSLFAR